MKIYKVSLSTGSRYEHHYCCLNCYRESLVKKEEQICDYCGLLYLIHPCRNRATGHHYCSQECSHKDMVGTKGSNWRGGKSSEIHSLRSSNRYKEWRLSVFKRDVFTCSKCGDVAGGNLEGHHILSFSRFPEARFSVGNGDTLCSECHKEFHDLYGRLKFTDKDYWEWLNVDA